MDRTCPTERGLTGQHVNQLVSATLIIPICSTVSEWMISSSNLVSADTGIVDQTRHSSALAVYQDSVITTEYELVGHRLEQDGVLGLVDGARVERDEAAGRDLTSGHKHSGTSSRQTTLSHGQAEPSTAESERDSKPDLHKPNSFRIICVLSSCIS